MIDFENVTKIYPGGHMALEDISLHIDEGEFVFILGHSGAGKSTFLKMMLREEIPTSGSVVVAGCDLVKMRRRQIPYFRRKLGIVFQDFRLINDMTVYDNVAFAMRVTGVDEDIIRKRVPYVLGLVGLTGKEKSYPQEISGGEQQRVALARAMVHSPKMIIADEPTGNIDPQMSLEMMELLKAINAVGITVVVVTHEHALAELFAKRIITIKEGHIVSDKPNTQGVL